MGPGFIGFALPEIQAPVARCLQLEESKLTEGGGRARSTKSFVKIKNSASEAQNATCSLFDKEASNGPHLRSGGLGSFPRVAG